MYQYYSQYQQDKVVNDLFVQNSKGGFFVDVGAHNGLIYSNSMFFEKILNWQGICIEPMESEFVKLEKLRKSININACAYSMDGHLSFRQVEDRQSPGMHSYNMLSGVVDRHSTKERADNLELGSQIIDLPCVRLETVFEKHGVEVVDFLSIDTEGSELEVLNGINFKAVHINLVCFEHNGVASIEEGAREILLRNNFRHVTNIVTDALYVNNLAKWSWEEHD